MGLLPVPCICLPRADARAVAAWPFAIRWERRVEGSGVVFCPNGAAYQSPGLRLQALPRVPRPAAAEPHRGSVSPPGAEATIRVQGLRNPVGVDDGCRRGPQVGATHQPGALARNPGGVEGRISAATDSYLGLRAWGGNLPPRPPRSQRLPEVVRLRGTGGSWRWPVRPWLRSRGS
jgi:hypothetical protein